MQHIQVMQTMQSPKKPVTSDRHQAPAQATLQETSGKKGRQQEKLSVQSEDLIPKVNAGVPATAPEAVVSYRFHTISN